MTFPKHYLENYTLFILFQHTIFFIAGLLMNVIPDVPKDVKLQIHRENEMEKQMLFEDEGDNEKNATNPSSPHDDRYQDGSNNNIRHRGGNNASTRL